MSDTPATDCLRDQAQMYREQKEAAEQASRMEQERLKRCRDAVAALGQSVYAMRCALDPFGPALKATERKAHCRKVTGLLAAALTALREADLLSRLEQLDEPATLAHYRKQHDDLRATRLCFACAKQIIEADPTERPRLAQLVQDAVEEASLRGAWDWLSILLYGLTGQQRLVWKQEPSELTAPNPSSPTRESAGSGKSGRPVPVAQGERATTPQTLAAQGPTERKLPPVKS